MSTKLFHTNDPKQEVAKFMHGLQRRNPGEPEFQQAVREVIESVMPFVLEHKNYQEAQILERLTEPDRIVIFRVSWEDDLGQIRANRAWRVQFNNSIGPYKGGMRFSPDVNQSVLKFLGFEQTFKNALTTLPMGGAKGGSNFNPKGKSDREVMRFCQSLMTELFRHVGEDTDVPAGDIGVGQREVSYMFGQYKRILNRWTGAMTGKGLSYGGSRMRTEATGYGCIYFAQDMLKWRGERFDNKTSVVSGSGNVAVFAAEKLIEKGAKVVTLSDSSGFIHDKDGIDEEKLNFVKMLKFEKRGRIREYADKYGCDYYEGKAPWGVPCDMAFPCATQNELNADDAKTLLSNGVILVAEGANMPCSADAVDAFVHARIMYGPGKAANAGGVAVSGLEQSQNALRLSWSREEVDKKLQDIMHDIHKQCVSWGRDGDRVNYVKGANLAGFVKVADALLSYGVV